MIRRIFNALFGKRVAQPEPAPYLNGMEAFFVYGLETGRQYAGFAVGGDEILIFYIGPSAVH